jgi:hypothetical protein
MRVLFVSGIDGFCHRYQVLHRAAQLARRGHTCCVRHAADPRWPTETCAADIAFLYRVPYAPHVAAGLAAARRRGVLALGSIDDLLFLPEPELFPELAAQDAARRELWMDGVRRYRATLEACDAFVAPTAPLADAASGLGWRTVLHRNSVSSIELELGAAARARRAAMAPAPARSGGATVLGYFSGTPTHDVDFATIVPVLARLLRDNPRLRLRLVGPLTLPRELDAHAARIERLPLVPWPDLPDLVASVDVSLAPLEMARPFARAKGEIKYLEAAAVGVATLASATPAYRDAICDRENGLLAASEEEWESALRELTADPALCRRLGEAARADLEERFAERTRSAELDAILHDLRASLPARAPRREGSAVVERPDGGDTNGGAHVPLARHALEPDALPAALEGDAGLGGDEDAVLRLVSPPLPPGHAIAQEVCARRDGLCRIDVHTVTYGLEPAYALRLRLYDADGALLAEMRHPARHAPDRGWLALEVPTQPASRGRRYRFEIAALDGAPGGAVSFGLTAMKPEVDAARIDGVPAAGPLRLRGFAASSPVLGEAAKVADGAAAPGDRPPMNPVERPRSRA